MNPTDCQIIMYCETSLRRLKNSSKQVATSTRRTKIQGLDYPSVGSPVCRRGGLVIEVVVFGDPLK